MPKNNAIRFSSFSLLARAYSRDKSVKYAPCAAQSGATKKLNVQVYIQVYMYEGEFKNKLPSGTSRICKWLV